jgi:hypothetical protein
LIGKTVNIYLSENQGTEAKASVYSLSGQLIGSVELKEGNNSIRLDIRKQPLIVKVLGKNISYYKKVMMW